MRLFNRNSIPLEDCILVWARGRGETNALDLSEGLGIGAGAIYPALYRLEQRGALTSWIDVPSISGKPGRRLYSLAASPAQTEEMR